MDFDTALAALAEADTRWYITTDNLIRDERGRCPLHVLANLNGHICDSNLYALRKVRDFLPGPVVQQLALASDWPKARSRQRLLTALKLTERLAAS